MRVLLGSLALLLLLGGCAQVRSSTPRGGASATISGSSASSDASHSLPVVAAAREIPRAPLAEHSESPPLVAVEIAGIGER